MEALEGNGEIELEAFFKNKADSSERVAAFLAVLELVKEKRIRIEDESKNIVLKLT